MAGVTDKLISLFEKYKVRDYLSAHSELVNLYAIHKLGLDDKSIHRLLRNLIYTWLSVQNLNLLIMIMSFLSAKIEQSSFVGGHK